MYMGLVAYLTLVYYKPTYTTRALLNKVTELF